MALYQLDSQKDLLKTIAFLGDTANCFKSSPYNRHSNRIRFREYSSDEETELLKSSSYLSVSDIARSIFGHYFRQAGYRSFDENLESFIKERKDLDFTAGFLMLLKLKATGGIIPFREERQSLADELRGKINEIEGDVDRAIYKIYLSSWEHELFSQNEKIVELKFLGKERIKKVLARHPPTNDPDLLNINKSEQYNPEYKKMCTWILLNADEIFDKEDVTFFLERAAVERENKNSWGTTMDFHYWHIAAARIDKANASDYLKSCIELFDKDYHHFERPELFAELWYLKGESEVEYILDWVFNSYRYNDWGKGRVDAFIRHLDNKGDIEILKRIIADNRFSDSIYLWNVILIAWQINQLREDKPIASDLTSEIRHPFGLEAADRKIEEAIKKYPDETQEMLQKIEILKEELRKIE